MSWVIFFFGRSSSSIAGMVGLQCGLRKIAAVGPVVTPGQGD
jgi:hypothetical protein